MIQRIIPRVHAQMQFDPNALVGEIDVPQGVDKINSNSAGSIGIIDFASNLVTVIIWVGGIWSLLNIVMAGYTYLTGQGKPDSHVKVKNSITMSVIGLALMVLSYTAAVLIGQIIYGDATFIISPKIEAL